MVAREPSTCWNASTSPPSHRMPPSGCAYASPSSGGSHDVPRLTAQFPGGRPRQSPRPRWGPPRPGGGGPRADRHRRVRERLALGVDHTVVALAGGTGSGKSSLFNRISRLNFADVGAKRPTTARITACSWSDQATALLDWLEVDPERRITRGSELDGDAEEGLDGLVLLDLPDHDSIEPAHQEVVNRVLPLVDLLVWVVDPQKYADDALHSGYLQKSVGLEASMVVALNQIDTVPTTQRGDLVADMGRLLEEDGLSGVYVTMVSARTGEGLGQVRELLQQAVARRSVAAGRVAGELDRAGALLLEQTRARCRGP
ncbi:GTPase [Oerskovia sp. M15]